MNIHLSDQPFSQRQLRVGELLKQLLGNLFLKEEVALPSINTRVITVSEVRMSPDLKHAKELFEVEDFVDEVDRRLETNDTTEFSGINLSDDLYVEKTIDGKYKVSYPDKRKKYGITSTTKYDLTREEAILVKIAPSCTSSLYTLAPVFTTAKLLVVGIFSPAMASLIRYSLSIARRVARPSPPLENAV